MMDIYLTGVLTSAWGHREGACFCGGVLIKMFAGKYNTDSKKQTNGMVVFKAQIKQGAHVWRNIWFTVRFCSFSFYDNSHSLIWLISWDREMFLVS